jgi:thymidine kinase
MFSGKTEALIGSLRKARMRGRRVIAAKPSLDDRYEQHMLVSHSGLRFPALAIDDPRELTTLGEAFAMVAVDEVHFFSEGVVHAALQLKHAGVLVVCAGLDRDFRGEQFASTTGLLASADRCEAKTAKCGICGGAAILTQRLVEGAPAPSTDQRIRVGGAELYDARCDQCYISEGLVRSAAPSGTRA